MAGDGIYDHHAAAFFHIFFFELFPAATEVAGHALCIVCCNVDHKLAATGTAKSTVYLRRNFIVEAMHHCVNVVPIFALQEGTEGAVFFFPFFCQLCNKFSICFGLIDVG